jgi:ADP-heptose:LPS heptosyltransferase
VPCKRITLLSFRTFGDYVLKAPFLFELARLYPGAEVTMITNRKGGQVYPLMDSRLKLVVVDHGDPKLTMLRKLSAVPRADLVFALDDSRTTLLLSLMVRGKRKTGWVQGISRLYAEGGFFEWKSVRPWLSAMVKAVYRRAGFACRKTNTMRKWNSNCWISKDEGQPLNSYRATTHRRQPTSGDTLYLLRGRSRVACKAAYRPTMDGHHRGLLQAFPKHTIVVHGASWR